MDPNLAFGRSVHILCRHNSAVFGLSPAIGVATASVISKMVVGFAKTQEQGFRPESVIIAIIAAYCMLCISDFKISEEGLQPKVKLEKLSMESKSELRTQTLSDIAKSWYAASTSVTYCYRM